MKGIGAIFFILIVGMIVMVSIWLFFVFFKVHVVGISVDVDSINRYQEIPTMLLSSTLFDGDDGSCVNAENEHLCKKSVAFHYMRSKVSGGDVVSKETDAGENFLNNFRVSLPLYCYRIDFIDSGVRKIFIDGKKDLSDLRRSRASGIATPNCGLDGNFKINEAYPIPTFADGVPAVASQMLLIGSSTTTTESSINTWPLYAVDFRFGGSG